MFAEPPIPGDTRDELEQEKVALEARLHSTRFVPLLAWVVPFAAVGIVYLAHSVGLRGDDLAGAFGAAVVACALALYAAAERTKTRALLARAVKKLDALARTKSAEGENAEAAYFRDLLTMNISNLRDYYLLVQSHTRASFLTSAGAGSLGFLLVVAGLIVGYMDDGTRATFTWVAAGSGIVMQFISGVFFYLYNRTVRQLKEYHDSLLDVQDVLLALKVMEGVKVEAEKSGISRLIIDALMKETRATTREVAAAASSAAGAPTG